MSTPPRPGLTTRAKNVNQRPGKILMSYQHTRRSSTQLAADKKAAKEAAAVVAAKNATIATCIAQLKDVCLNLCHASTTGKHTTAIEKSCSDSVVLGNQSLLATSVEVRKHTKALKKPASADAKLAISTTADHQVLDIVLFAQTVIAELEGSKQEATINSIRDTKPQSYTLCSYSYYSHRKSRLHLPY